VIHFGANYLLRNFPITLQIPLVVLLWWELTKEFPRYGMMIQGLMTGLQLIELYIINQYPAVFAFITPFEFSVLQFVVIFIICAVGGAKFFDNIILNYVLFGISMGNLIIHFFPPEVMLTISMTLAGSDGLQYFFGKLFGKTKIVPKISPNKSLEGYIGAVVVCNAIHFWLMHFELNAYNHIYVNGMLLAGILGDLFISWWKRNHHIKDTSHLLTGHGGFLDRLDSHIAAWIWSYVFAVMTNQATNSQMDYSRIELLIYVAWVFVWSNFFWVAFKEGRLI